MKGRISRPQAHRRETGNIIMNIKFTFLFSLVLHAQPIVVISKRQPDIACASYWRWLETECEYSHSVSDSIMKHSSVTDVSSSLGACYKFEYEDTAY